MSIHIHSNREFGGSFPEIRITHSHHMSLKKENFPILVRKGSGGVTCNLPEHAFAREIFIVLRYQLFPLYYFGGGWTFGSSPNVLRCRYNSLIVSHASRCNMTSAAKGVSRYYESTVQGASGLFELLISKWHQARDPDDFFFGFLEKNFNCLRKIFRNI